MTDSGTPAGIPASLIKVGTHPSGTSAKRLGGSPRFSSSELIPLFLLQQG